MRILIATADPELRRWLHLTLSDWGYEVVAVNDGAEAWQKLQAEAAPPLAILDRVMPGLDGLELCRRVRQTPALLPSYIILLTETGGPAEIEAGLAAGADDFLTKPCSTQELQARLQIGARVAWLQSELVQRDKHLEESEGRYTALFRDNHVATLLLDPATGDIIDANLAACNFYGYSHTDLTRMKISDINQLSPEQVFKVMQEVKLAHRKSYNFKYRLAGGAIVDVEVFTGPIKVGNRQLLCSMAYDITERKRMEAALHESESRYRLIVDSLKAVIFQIDAAGRWTFLNPAWAEITGFSVSDCLGTPYLNYLHADDQPRGTELFQELLHQDIEYCRQGLRFVSKEGHLSWLEMYAQLIWTAEGSILGISGILSDITDRKRAEQALRTSETRFRTLTTHAPVGIFETNAQGKMVFASQRLCDLAGLSLAEALGGGWDNATHPDDRERVLSEWTAAIQAGREFAMEYRFQTPAGQVNWVSARAVPLQSEAGEFSGYIGTVTDITESKQAEMELARERTLLRSLMDNLPDQIYIKDRASHFLLVNPTTARILGAATPEAVVGKNDFDFSPLELAQQYYADEQALFESGQPLLDHEEPIIDQQTGQQRWNWSTKVPFQDETGQIVGLIGLNRDITERKQMEEALRQAKETAEVATRVKSEFLANMSHEIRTPLNAIIGMTSLLLDTPLSSEQQDFAETVRTSGEALLTLINDILDFSKIEAGKLDLEKQPFDLRQCIEEALDLVTLKAAEKNLNLAYSISKETPDVLVGDVTRLRQILVNLLNNAVKFTEQGEVVLSVRSQHLRRTAGESQVSQAEEIKPTLPVHQVHFSVRDTGLGIPPDRMDRLFQSFSQVDASTTRKYGGTGLGLTISKRLSEMMGGEMWVESPGIPGEGATFHFSIRAEAALDQPRVHLHGQPELTGKQLLIVDDNATNRLILARQAQFWGMQPRAAVSAREALAWISRGDHFDLVILDMQMPDMDGLTLAVAIRRLEEDRKLTIVDSSAETEHLSPIHPPRSSKLPLVMLTSIGLREDNDLVDQVEFVAFLTKPVKSSQLYNVLLRVFADQPIQIKPVVASPSFDSQLSQTHPLHILLAEDNLINQKVAIQMLARMGYRADIAANGLEVLEALQRQPYDVVLMDMQMPEMDGLEATQAIHSRWSATESPWIIAMTANALQGDRERCLEAGMNDYVSKPVRPEELAQALSRCQPISQQHQAARVSTQPLNKVEPESDRDDASFDQNASVLNTEALTELGQFLGEQAPQLISELINMFFETSEPLLEAMRVAVQTQDGPALHRAAHSLKPSSAYMGALHLAELCQELETMGRAGQLQGTAFKLTELEAEFSQVITALKFYLANEN